MSSYVPNQYGPQLGTAQVYRVDTRDCDTLTYARYVEVMPVAPIVVFLCDVDIQNNEPGHAGWLRAVKRSQSVSMTPPLLSLCTPLCRLMYTETRSVTA